MMLPKISDFQTCRQQKTNPLPLNGEADFFASRKGEALSGNRTSEQVGVPGRIQR
jgi:hypothetical protein